MKLATFGHPFPFDHEQMFIPGGKMSPTGSRFLRALYDRTGGGSGIIPSVKAGLIAAGNSQVTALQLRDDWNHIGTTAPGTGAQIPALQIGQEVYVANDGANPLSIYPPGGWVIDAYPINGAYSLPTTKMQKFRVIGRQMLRSLQLGPP
jgi:hypothetical protein